MMETYPEDRLYEEVAFIAYHFNWSREEVMALPHSERQRWCEEISDINSRMNEERDRAGGGATSSDDSGVTLTQPIDFDTSE
jgi:hypothetical protein